MVYSPAVSCQKWSWRNGSLLTWPIKPSESVQIKGFKSSCSFQGHPSHLWNCPSHQGSACVKSHQISLKDVPLQILHSILHWWGCHCTVPNGGAKHRFGGTKSVGFFLHMIKNAENSADLTVLNVDYLRIQYIQVNKISKCAIWQCSWLN